MGVIFLDRGGSFLQKEKHHFYPHRQVLHRVYPSSHVFPPSGFSATLCFHPVVFPQHRIERPTIAQWQNPYQPTENQQTRLKSPINALYAPLHEITRTRTPINAHPIARTQRQTQRAHRYPHARTITRTHAPSTHGKPARIQSRARIQTHAHAKKERKKTRTMAGLDQCIAIAITRPFSSGIPQA